MSSFFLLNLMVLFPSSLHHSLLLFVFHPQTALVKGLISCCLVKCVVEVPNAMYVKRQKVNL